MSFIKQPYPVAVFSVLVALVMLFSTATVAQDNASVNDGTHTVQSGENLYRIALRYGLTIDELAQANGITDPSTIYRGQVLTIPGLSTVDADEVFNPLIAGTPTIHVVQPGETLNTIASIYDLTPEQLLQANDIANPNLVFRGQELTVWTTDSVSAPADAIAESEPAVVALPEDELTVYVVRRGEHLSQIAERFGVDWRTVAQINGITDPDRVFAGQELRIPALSINGLPNEDMGILTQQGPGATVLVGRQIVVDLSDSRTYAYEDGQLVHSVLVSTGLPATPTVTGDFTIYLRYRSQTMSGPGYYLPNVEYVQYFYQGYGIHGTYWHNNFGQPMSHGCVNMTNADAQWFFEFGEIGTPVRVQY